MIIYSILFAFLSYLHNWKIAKSPWAERNDLVGVPSGWFVLARNVSMMRVCGHGVSACGGHRVRWCDVLNKTDLGKGLALTPQCSDPALSPTLAAIITSPLKNDWMVLSSFVSVDSRCFQVCCIYAMFRLAVQTWLLVVSAIVSSSYSW